MAPNENIGDVPPPWALQEVVLQAHRTRLDDFRIGGYHAAHHAHRLFEALPDTPEAAATVLTRSTTSLTPSAFAILSRIAREVQEACNCKIY